MRSRLATAAALGLAIVSLAACTKILGKFSASGKGVAPGSGGAAGAGGGQAGAGQGASHGTGGAGGDTGSGGSGGQAPCDLGVIGACGMGKKCSADGNTGAIACYPAGSLPAWNVCGSDAECADGTWCDLVLTVCKPFCHSTADCPSMPPGACLPATDASNKAINPQMMVCVANCEPRTISPCQPTTNCVLRQGIGFDCVKSGEKPVGQLCQTSSECVAGAVCVTKGVMMLCSRWCGDPGMMSPDCPNQGFCNAFNPPVLYENKEYGFCY